MRGTAPVPSITSVVQSLNAFSAVREASNDDVSPGMVARAAADPEFAGLVQGVELDRPAPIHS